MKITRIGFGHRFAFLAIVAGLMLGGCAAFQPAPVALKNQVEPVMRTTGAEMSADRYYEAGRSAMRSGDMRGARKFFAQALLQDPNYIDAINAMAAILTVQGRYSDSLVLMRQAVERAPEDAMFRRNLERVEKLAAREQGQLVVGEQGQAAGAPVADAAAAGTPAAATTGADAGAGTVGAAPGAVASASMTSSAVAPATQAPASAVSASLTGLDVGPSDAPWAVVEVAPNVYQLQLPQMAAAPAQAQPGSPAGIAAAAGRSQASPTAALSAPWIRAAGQAPAAAADEAASRRTSPQSGVTTVSYKRDVQAPGQVRVMVTNGMGREGWAARHAGLLGALGMTPARITNHRHYGVEQTLIRYRAGLQTEAERIIDAVATLGNARLVADDQLPAGIDLQVILGRDSQPQRQGPTT